MAAAPPQAAEAPARLAREAIGVAGQRRQWVHLGLRLHLRQKAWPRGLVGAPAEELGAVAEAAAGEVVVADFDDQLGRERLPLGAALGGPAAGPAGGLAGETGRPDERLEHLGQLGVLGRF